MVLLEWLKHLRGVAVDPVAPILTYYYIESPDSAFHYPLFATEEEAQYLRLTERWHGLRNFNTSARIYVDDAVAGTTMVYAR